ncbi:MAG: L-arabinose isomerase, partial [Eubacterium sp.]
MAIKDYEFWFVVGTQHLYGQEIFTDINSHAQEMCEEWSSKLPCRVVAKPCVKTSAEILGIMRQANNNPACAGVITWMHTFSPSKMWIAGLNELSKPYLHVNTQYNRDIPWNEI